VDSWNPEPSTPCNVMMQTKVNFIMETCATLKLTVIFNGFMPSGNYTVVFPKIFYYRAPFGIEK